MILKQDVADRLIALANLAIERMTDPTGYSDSCDDKAAGMGQVAANALYYAGGLVPGREPSPRKPRAAKVKAAVQVEKPKGEAE